MGLPTRPTNPKIRETITPTLRGGRAKLVRAVPKNGTDVDMLDRFDRMLLNLVQLDSGRTADSLAKDLPLSPSAIARRIRGHRKSGIIHRTISLLSPKLAENRIRVIAMLQLGDHGEHKAIRALEARLAASPAVQFAFELAGSIDIIVMLDCPNMREFNETFKTLIQDDPTVHRFECHFVKREFRYVPFIDLLDSGVE